MKTDGTGLVNITQDDQWVVGHLVWSPNSRKIAYVNDNQIWLIEILTN
jgi:Tol biopolymer transport system component